MLGSNSVTTTITSRPISVWQFLNPIYFMRNFWQRRELILQFTRREIQSRYQDAFLGIFWSFVNPLVLLLIYTFVFGVVFKARWGQDGSQSLGQFALVVFCGFTTFNIFSECIGRSSYLIISVPHYVKKVVFPLEILSVCICAAALFHGAIGFGILLVVSLIVNHTVHWTFVLLPIVALPLIFLTLGLSWFLASLGVFIRDINYIVTLVVQVLFFSAAIFYPIENIPEPYRTLIRVNPLLPMVEDFRRVILWGRLPSWPELASWIVISAIIMLLGYAWFMKTKKAFADVI